MGEFCFIPSSSRQGKVRPGNISADASNHLPTIIPRMGSSPSRARQDLYLRMHCVNVYVRDQERSLRFYLDQLGFHLAFDTRLQTGERWVAVAPPDGSAVLTLVAPEPDSKEHKLIGRATGIVLVTEDVITKYEEWRRRGVQF